jgi:regulator of sirC expression with transglutaminase-like and TPR domain
MIVVMTKLATSSFRLLLSALLGVATIAIVAAPPDEDTPLLRGLEKVESDHAALCPSTGGQKDLGRTIAELADQARAEIVSRASGPATVEALNRLVFTRLGVRGSEDLKDPCNLLPSRVLERKQGYCVGIAALYLLLAEKLSLPIYAVATPSHVFLRYDDGNTRINIETLQGGANVPDEQYIREQRIPEKSIRRGVFMRNLTADEFLAQVYNNLGVIYSERKDYERAAAEYRRALDLDPRFPATLYNFGNDLLKTGNNRRAVRLFSKSLRLYPTDIWALNNRGLAYVKLGKREKARRDFEEALRIDPGFKQAIGNLDVIDTH